MSQPTFDDCEALESFIELLDAEPREEGPYVQLLSADVEDIAPVLKRALDYMLAVG